MTPTGNGKDVKGSNEEVAQLTYDYRSRTKNLCARQMKLIQEPTLAKKSFNANHTHPSSCVDEQSSLGQIFEKAHGLKAGDNARDICEHPESRLLGTRIMKRVVENLPSLDSSWTVPAIMVAITCKEINSMYYTPTAA